MRKNDENNKNTLNTIYSLTVLQLFRASLYVFSPPRLTYAFVTSGIFVTVLFCKRPSFAYFTQQ